jgi:predicted nucleic acid-binding protein
MLQEFQNDSAVITDTSCFILLDKINALHLLPQLYSNVLTTPEIAREFGIKLPNWVEIKPVVNRKLIKKYTQKVDIGEASAIALSLEVPSALLTLDDLKGRKLALQLNLKHTGTLGILILAKQTGIIPSLQPFFEKVSHTNFRISIDLLQNILKTYGE